MDSPPQEEASSLQMDPPITSVAAKALADENILVVDNPTISAASNSTDQKMESSPQEEESSPQLHAPITNFAAEAPADKNLPEMENPTICVASNSSGQKMDLPPEEEESSLQSHAPIASGAVKALADEDIPVIDNPNIYPESNSSDESVGSPPQEEKSWLQHHLSTTSVAAKALADRNIPVMEYGQQIQWRHGDPVVLMLVEWIVPDELLSESSQALSDSGFPCVPPCEWATDSYRAWDRAGVIHQLSGRYSVNLYPLSLIGLALQDTIEVSSTFDRTVRVLTPKPQPYMVSLIRQLLNRPLEDNFRLRIQDNLLSFISFYILHEKPLNTKYAGWEDDLESEEDFQRRLENGVREMKAWGWDAADESYLLIAESVVRNCRSIDELSNC